MKILKNFFECYFNQSFYFDDLDQIIEKIKKLEHEAYHLDLIRELHSIIQTRSYDLASRIIKKYGGKSLNIEESERVIKYIYDKLLGKDVTLDTTGFYRDCKCVFCPICCPDPEKVTTFSLIQKATVIKNSQEIYICKPCKLVWLSEDIRADNAQDYKKFMRTLGLNGTWKELSNIDIL